jgi:DNA-binding XRE family transcriptional regulator
MSKVCSKGAAVRSPSLARELGSLGHLALLQFQDNAMDLWGFKKWRRELGYTQVEAGEKLGLGRGTVQYWESEIRPVPLAVELACQELQRLWKQRPEFGPVTLLYASYADDPMSLETSAFVGSILVRSERHPNIENALKSAARPRETITLFIAFIVEDDGNVIWSGPELLREIDARNDTSIGEKTSAAKSPSSR